MSSLSIYVNKFKELKNEICTTYRHRLNNLPRLEEIRRGFRTTAPSDKLNERLQQLTNQFEQKTLEPVRYTLNRQRLVEVLQEVANPPSSGYFWSSQAKRLPRLRQAIDRANQYFAHDENVDIRDFFRLERQGTSLLKEACFKKGDPQSSHNQTFRALIVALNNIHTDFGSTIAALGRDLSHKSHEEHRLFTERRNRAMVRAISQQAGVMGAPMMAGAYPAFTMNR